MVGGAAFSEGHLPREESPSDPLFFGVTPGEPGFGPTPSPREAVAPPPGCRQHSGRPG